MVKTLSDGSTYYGPSFLGEIYDAITNTSTWLYGDWNEEKYNVYTGLSALPLIGDYMDYLLDRRADSEYLNRYGLDYTDIHDPRKLRSTSSGSRLAGYYINSVSKNVNRLYR